MSSSASKPNRAGVQGRLGDALLAWNDAQKETDEVKRTQRLAVIEANINQYIQQGRDAGFWK